MKGAVIYSPGDIRVVDLEIPKPSPEEVLIQVAACGVCGTEHTLYTGGYYANYPVVLGHEFAGVVMEVGEKVTKFKTGDRVTVDPNRVCHKCDYCQIGRVHLCADLVTYGITHNGGDADFMVAAEENVYRLPDSMTLEEGAFVEPLACALRAFEVAEIELGDTVLVLGAGSMGNLITQCVALSGAANVITSEPIKLRRDLALKNGATMVIDPMTQDVDAEVRKVKRIGADVVIEVVGGLKAQSKAIGYARRGGQVVFYGVSPKGGKIEVSPFDINENEIKVTGSFNNPYTTAQAITLIASRKIRVDNLVTHRIQLERYNDIWNLWGGEDTVKLMVTMENGA
jgi:2-desacetyl-2-hydroxyethyl bacteriochlorophyllide A dehydrogenase